MRYVSQISAHPLYRAQLYDVYTGTVVAQFASIEMAETTKEIFNARARQEAQSEIDHGAAEGVPQPDEGGRLE